MRSDKQLLLDEIRESIDKYGSFVLIKYLGLSANAASSFRSEVAGLGGDMLMVRKRILDKAAQAAGITLDFNALQGHIGLVFAGKDAIETTKAVFRFSKENDNCIEVVGGRFDGTLYNANDVEKLSKLPGKKEMQAQLLATLEAPMAHFLGVQHALLASVMYCLDNKAKQEENA